MRAVYRAEKLPLTTPQPVVLLCGEPTAGREILKISSLGISTISYKWCRFPNTYYLFKCFIQYLFVRSLLLLITFGPSVGGSGVLPATCNKECVRLHLIPTNKAAATCSSAPQQPCYNNNYNTIDKETDTMFNQAL